MALLRETSGGYMTNLAGRLFVRALEKRLASMGLSPAHMPVFFALERGPRPQKALAERAGVEQPTMTATLQRMERDGLVERIPNPDDGRSTLVRLTPLAEEKLSEMEEIVKSINAMAFSDLSKKERKSYFALLTRIIATLEAAGEKADKAS